MQVLDANSMQDSMEKSEFKQQIQRILDRALAQKDTDIKLAIDTLNESKYLIPQYIRKQSDIMEQSFNQGIVTDEQLYNQKVGDIFYQIEDYEKALDFYNQVAKKIDPNAYQCMSYDTSIQNISNFSEKPIEEINQMLQMWDSKIQSNLDNPDPIDYCNKAQALYKIGKKEESLECYKRASQILKNTKSDDMDTNEALDQLIQQIETLSNLKLQQLDKIMDTRECKYIDKITCSLVDIKNKKSLGLLNEFNYRQTLQPISDTKSKLMEIQAIPFLNGFYDGLLYTLTEAYTTATVVNSGVFQIHRGSVDAGSRIISLIPLIGHQLSIGIQSVYDLNNNITIKKAAANVCKFASNSYDFNEIIQDAIVEIILQRQRQLKKINVQKVTNVIIPQWEQKFSNIVNMFKKNIFGDRFDTPMQRLGYKIASELVENYIANGKIYAEKHSINMSPQEKREKIIIITLRILDQDIERQNLKFDQNVINQQKYEIDAPLNDKHEKVCCKVFRINVNYQNEILNNQDIFLYCVKHLGIKPIIDNADKIDKQLIQQAIKKQNFNLVLKKFQSIIIEQSYK